MGCGSSSAAKGAETSNTDNFFPPVETKSVPSKPDPASSHQVKPAPSQDTVSLPTSQASNLSKATVPTSNVSSASKPSRQKSGEENAKPSNPNVMPGSPKSPKAKAGASKTVGQKKPGNTTAGTSKPAGNGKSEKETKSKSAESAPAPTTPSQSPSKKKSSYVPPSPITATVPVLDISASLQPPPIHSEKPEKAMNTSLSELPKINGSQTKKQLQGSANSFDLDGEESIDADNFLAEVPTGDKEKLAQGSGLVNLDGGGDDDEDDFGRLVLNRDEFEAAPPVFDDKDDDDPRKPPRPWKDATETPEPSSESGMRFDELYRLKGVLGTGAFSTVREGFHRTNADISYAVKCINRKKLSEEDEAALLDEVSILKAVKHRHIIRLYDFFVEPSTYYLVMERMRGGELFDRIVAKAYYNEKEARDTCKIVLEAVGFCHSHSVAHRDLKPENLLLLSEDDDSTVKIADFGFAKRVLKPNSLTTQCGTPGYVAPEILEGTPYDERADMWSVGVILYILLGGYPPFIESTQRDLFRKIRKGEYEFHEEYWGTVSNEAKDLIKNLLKVDYVTRYTAPQALQDSWILGDDAKLANRDLGANLDKLRNFNAKRKFRAAVATIMAVNKLNSLSSAFFNKPFQELPT